MRSSRFLASTFVLTLAACGGSDDDALFAPGGGGAGASAAGSNAAGTSSGGKAGSATTGGASGSATTGGASGSTTTGGASGSTTTGGASGSTTTGGASGSTATGGAAGKAGGGGKAGAGGTGAAGKATAGTGGTSVAGAAGTGTAGTGTAGTGTAGTGTAGTGTAGTSTAGTSAAGAGGSVPAPTCSDALKNQDESDVDCGGATCKPCMDGQACLKFSDCVGGICNAGLCETTPTCTDGQANGNETDVDCGGPTACDRCADGQACKVGGDCKGGTCSASVCKTPLVFGLGAPQNVTGALLNEPWFADIGDIDNDGQPDVIVADNTGNRVTFLKNTAGALAATSSTATCGSPFHVLLRKMNADANLDLVIACSSGSTQLLAGNGAGAFGGAINFTHPTVWANIVEELGGQQGNDLVTISNVTGQNTFVRFGNGVMFAPPLIGTYGQAPSHGIAVDLTGDGIRDVVVTGQQTDGNGNQVYISKNNGNTTFTPLASLTVPAGPRSVATADFNGDGFADLVVASQTADALTVFLGKGDGTFGAPIGIAGGDGARWAAAVDLDGDGDTDIASVSVNDDLLHVFLNDGVGGFAAQPVISLAPAGEPRAIVAGDLNGDGLPDLVIPYSTSASFQGGVLVFLNTSK